MLLSQILSKTGVYSEADPSKIEILSVCDDTRYQVEGALFILREGNSFSPQAHIQEIEDGGAVALLLPRDAPTPRTSLPCFYSDDILATAEEAFEKYYGTPGKHLRLFAVTGTNGKTSTALILKHLFEASGIKSGYIGTLGIYLGDELISPPNGMTTPEPRILYKVLHEFAKVGVKNVVLEISSHAITQKRASRLRFESVIFTNLSEDHLDYHKSMESYFEAKKSLFQQADRAFINIDDPYGERLFNSLTIPKESVAVLADGADYRITDLYENGTDSTKYLCCAPFGSFEISYPLFGSFNVYNTLIAIAAALRAGICPREIMNAAKSIKRPSGRLEKLPIEQEYSVIIDYAHTPDAMEQVIKITKRQTRGRLFVLFGAGGDRERQKRAQMGSIATRLVDKAFITADNSRTEPLPQIFSDILGGIDRARKNYIIIPERAKAIRIALSELSPGDTLLLLGKGHEDYLIENGVKTPFSEKEIIYDYIKENETK